MSLESKKRVFEQFADFITKERREKIILNAGERTRYLTVVLEDIFQAHNISAVLRSCECLGVQDVHIIEHKHTFSVREDVAKGSAQWLSLKQYNDENNSTALCFEQLRARGYKIVATTPHEKDVFIDHLPLDQKIALVFGTEQQGLSSYALTHADAYVKIPMYGFTESFNISVSVALSLYELTQRLRSSAVDWRLSLEERVDLQLEWLGKTTHRTEQIKEALSKLPI